MNDLLPRVALEPTGLDANLSETELAVQESVHGFAEKVMRPAGRSLDRLSPQDVIAAHSDLWRVFGGFPTLGLTFDLFARMPGHERGRALAIMYEEMGWGDAGLAVALGSAAAPASVMLGAGRTDLLQRYADKPLGCWGITDPEHGSDMLDGAQSAAYPGTRHGPLNCVARLDGDHIVIAGQKSPWISNGTTAQIVALFCGFDDGSGDTSKRCAVLVPLDLPGVSRGEPLDKLGQRALPQGAILFDNVRVPRDHLLADPEHYARAEHLILCDGNAMMGGTFTGVARAAYEHALAYAHQRRQGGVALIRHQNVRARLFQMFRKVEAARALARRAFEFNHSAPMPSLQGSIAAKITATQTAFDVASEALQMFGARGLTPEYPVEKILRDARASMIEDGCNEFLSIKGGTLLADPSCL